MFNKKPREPKDTEYLAISARLHVWETRLLTRERMEQLIEAREDGEAAKILADCGYPEPVPLTLSRIERSLGQAQEDLFAELAQAVADHPQVLDVFRIRYDYHNAKALLKAEAQDQDPQRLLVSGGRYEPKALLEAYRRGDLDAVSPTLREAATQARELLATSKDPQRSDFLLDKACYQEMLEAARASGSDFLTGYVRLLIDSLNLRAAVRATRAGRGEEFLERALIPGGTVPTAAVLTAKGEALVKLFQDTPLRDAAQAGAALLEPEKGDMTAFERLCDDAVTAYMAKARQVPFGIETVIGYLYARQTESTAIRIVLSGRLAEMDKDKIRERLREAYV